MAKEQFIWAERYRPNKIEDCILSEELKEIFSGIVEKGDIPNLLLYGPAGCGKTSVAKSLCHELSCDYIFLNGSLGAEESGIEAFRTRVRSFASSVSFVGKRKIVIVDEADYLSAAAQPALRALIEEFNRNTSFIFTCNNKNRLIEPIHSRCSNIEFRIPKAEKGKIATQFLKRIFYILKEENIECTDKKIVADVVMKFFPDFRRCLNELQKFSIASNGKIDVGILSKALEVDLNLSELHNALKKRDFNALRKWAVEAMTDEPGRVFRKIYDGAKTFLSESSVPPLVILIADYQFKASWVADQEINLLAFLTELMVDENIQIL